MASLPKLPEIKKIPPAKAVKDEYTEEWELKEQKPDIPINDRTKLAIREAYPNFITSKLEIFYYQAMYDQIKKNGETMQSVDTYALGMLALNLSLVNECNVSIQEKGMNMEYQGDRKMVLKRNPALDVLKDAQAAVRFYLQQFNMTPKSRGLVLTPGAGLDDDDGFGEV